MYVCVCVYVCVSKVQMPTIVICKLLTLEDGNVSVLYKN